MKKLLVTLLTIMTCGAAYALPVGNPSDPILLTEGILWDTASVESCDPCDPYAFNWDLFSVRIGYYGDFVFNRNLEVRHGAAHRIERSEFNTNAGLLALNIWDRIDLYGTFGATNGYIESNASTFGIPATSARFAIATESEFSWSVGTRGTLWECGCTAIGLDARYFRTRPDISRLTYGDEVSLYPSRTFNMKYSEWQVSLGISHRINMFVPYAAVKWSRAHVDFRNSPAFFPVVSPTAADFPALRNEREWGYAVGVSLVDCDMMSLNVEGRFYDEKAIAVNAQVRF